MNVALREKIPQFSAALWRVRYAFGFKMKQSIYPS
jgi:hypothetical protein